VTGNIVYMLSSFLRCSEFDHIIFCWVMHEQAIIDGILARLPLDNCEVHAVSLLCSEEELRFRLQIDINAGLRMPDVIERSLVRLPMYEKLGTRKIDTTRMTVGAVAQAIQNGETDVKLIRAGCESAELIWKMQVEAFAESYEKYQDAQTNPAAEPMERVLNRLQQPFTYYYLIGYGDNIAGAIRVIDKQEPDECKRISPVFILKPFRNQGLAQKAIGEAEQMHGSKNWALETILEEPQLCRLYEKLGYRATGKTQKINERLTLAYYQK